MILAAQQSDDWSPDWATHPGEHLEEHLEARGWSQAEFVRLSGLNKKLVSEIISQKNPVTPETAIVLERVLGMKAYIWTGLQAQWDLFQARRRKSKVAPDARAWMKRFPLGELRQSGALKNTDDEELTLDGLLGFLGIGEPSAYEARLHNVSVHHRQASGNVSRDHVFCWLLLGERQAREMNLPPYSEAHFKNAVNEIRELTCLKPETYCPRMVELCRSAGVAVIFEPALPNTKLYGSARWLEEDRALIQMSLRMKKNDHFWWTFFHECAHLLLHRGKNFADDKPGEGDRFEQEANAWAEEILVGRQLFERFRRTQPRSKEAVAVFARSINLHPGIVVGMLQHARVVEFRHMNDLKQTIDFNRAAL
jgi:HTH-type transcriptional regulator/antitoxin HigA